MAVATKSLDELQSARLAMERETVMDCEAILERLRSSESVKLATLNRVQLKLTLKSKQSIVSAAYRWRSI